MDNALILFTNYFPYYRGEEYLENEIPIAVQYYKKILIIPTMVNSKMTQTRIVPDGVEIFVPDVDCSLFGKIKMFLKYSLQILSERDMREKMKIECKNSITKRFYYLYFQSRVRNVIKKVEIYDFSVFDEYKITAYSYWMHAVASIAMQIRKLEFKDKPVQLICRGHRYDLYAYRNRLNFIPDRLEILQTYTWIFPCSMDGVRYLSKEYPNFKNIIHLQRLGTMDHGKCSCSQEQPCLLLSCSSVTKVKRLEIIVDLIAEFKKQGETVKWVHFGDGPEINRLKRYAAKFLDKGVFVFKGHVSNGDLLAYYKECSPLVFINVSSSEGIPVSIMEAQSFGIPVIATNVGGSGELIKNGENGYLIPKDFELKKLMDKVNAPMKMSKSSYMEMCERSRKMWQKKSDAEKIYNEFYLSLTEENGNVL